MPYSDTPTVSGSYGPYTNNKFDLYRHPDGARPGGNPVLLYIHGGGWNGGNYKEVQSTASSNIGQTVASYFGTAGRNPRFDLVSIAYRCGNTTTAGSPATGLKFGRTWLGVSFLHDIQQAIQYLTVNAKTLGIAASIVPCGNSAGGTGVLLNHFNPRPPCSAVGITPGNWRFDVSSEPAASINIRAPIEVGFDGDLAYIASSFTQNLIGHPNTATDQANGDRRMAGFLSPRRKLRPSNRPILNWYEATGPQSRPYANPHAQEQATELAALMRSVNVDHTEQIGNNPTNSTDAGLIFDWLKSRLGANV